MYVIYIKGHSAKENKFYLTQFAVGLGLDEQRYKRKITYLLTL
jgi:hypothetical protein